MTLSSIFLFHADCSEWSTGLSFWTRFCRSSTASWPQLHQTPGREHSLSRASLSKHLTHVPRDRNGIRSLQMCFHTRAPNHVLAVAFVNNRAPCEDTLGFCACSKDADTLKWSWNVALIRPFILTFQKLSQLPFQPPWHVSPYCVQV